MSDATPHLGLPLIAAAQAQKHVTHNEALGLLDALVQLACLDKDLAAPPASPTEGDRYLVTAANPTGAWTGLSGQVVRFQDGVWTGAVPKPGWFAYVVDETDLYIFDGSAWSSFRRAITAIQLTSRLGINTTPDPTNRLALKSDAALLSWDDVTPGSGDMRVSVNKRAAARDAGLIFQTGYSARALLGTLGSDDLSLKVSADGASFSTVLTASAATGGIDFASADTALAASATTDIGAAGTRRVVVSGSAVITSFGTNANRERFVRFSGNSTLVHDATKLVLPTRANIVTAVDDTCIATSDASGNWRMRHYQRADGTPLASGNAGGAVASVAGRTGAVTLTSADLTDATALGKAVVTAPSAALVRSTLGAAASGANADITALAGPALGAATAATASAGTSTTQVATTAFVAASFLTTASAVAAYAPLASPTLTGTPSAPTAAAGTNTTQVATTAFVLGKAATAAPAMNGTAAAGTSVLFARQDHVHPADGTRAPIASPTFTGAPAAPTAAADTNTTQLATTAFVLGQAATAAPVMNGTAAPGTATRYARADHVHPTDASLAPLASPALTGTPTAPNAAAGTNTAQLATTSFVAASFVTYGYAAATYATAANATLTGTPTAPTAAAKDNSTRLATTAYADRGDAAAFARTQVNDAAYAILSSDRTVAVIALTAPRVLTLPAASAYPQGTTLTVIDESGACSAANTLTVARNSASDAIGGAASALVAAPNGYLALQSNGANKWTVIDAPAPAVPAFRNRIRNGAFGINQRVVSGTVTLAAGAYGHDGWKAGANGASYTFATAGNGDATVTGAGTAANTLIQVIEGALYLPEGGAYVLSWVGTATARVYQGSASAAPAFAAGSQAVVAGQAVNVLAVTGLSAGTDTSVEFNLAGGLALRVVQFEPGASASPFERRDDELRRCLRYYEKSYAQGQALGAAGYAGSVMYSLGSMPSATYAAQVYIAYQATKRVAPTVTLYSPATGAAGMASDYNGGSPVDVSAYAFNANDRSFQWYAQTGGARTKIDLYGAYVASAEL